MTDREPDPETSEVPAPAHITRTSRELLGQRALPRVLRERLVIYVLGPAGVGKTTVGRCLCGEPREEVTGEQLRKVLIGVARRSGRFPAELLEAPALLLDGVDFLYNRFGAVDLLGKLLRDRADAGRRTVVCQGPSDGSVTLLYAPVPLQQRASVLLRFPVGKGRRRYVKERCEALGLLPSQVRGLRDLDPWSYAGVEAVLLRRPELGSTGRPDAPVSARSMEPAVIVPE